MKLPNHILGLITLILYISPAYLWPDMSDQFAWFILQLCCLLFLTLLFRLTIRHEIGLRVLWSLGIFYTAGEILTDWWLPEQYVLLIGPLEFLIYFLGFVWITYRPAMRSTSDERNEENVFLVFYRPQTYFDMIKAILGMPVVSLSVYAGGKWLRFRRSEKYLQLLDIRPNTERYLLIDTGVKVDQEMKTLMRNLEGAPARHWSSLYFRCRCVLSLTPILHILGTKWVPKGLDFIPGIYSYRRLNNE